MASQRTILFQIHLRRGEPLKGRRAQLLRCLIVQNGGDIQREEYGHDRGLYLNVFVASDRLHQFWQRVTLDIQKHHQITQSLIVLCQGTRGWDDHLLLRHFKRRQKLDRLSEKG
jgi:hypothetical protein